MSRARSVECQCTYNFTCGYCLRNAKPYFFTFSDGSGTYQLPAFLCQPSAAKVARVRESVKDADNE